LIAVLAAAVAVHVSVAWQDLPTLARNGYLYDDSFYAFQIARNIAAGHGPSFDGTTLTNGFQPLYVALLVPLYAVTGGDPVLPIHLALVMLSLLSVATAYLLYRILRRYAGDGVAVSTALLWVFSPVVIRQTANGLETALATFLLAASVYYYLSRVRPDAGVGRGAFVRLGVLLGLAVLARLDLVLLALAVALDYLLVARGRKERAAVANVLSGFAAAVLVYSPWFVYGVVAVGHVVPESGLATRFLSMAYAPFFGMGSGEVANGPDAGFVWAHVVRSLSVLKLTPATHALFRLVEKASAGTPAAHLVQVAANALGLLLLAGFVVWFVARGRNGRAGEGANELAFLLLFSVSLMAAYSFYVFGAFFFIRYFYPVYFVATIFFGLVVRDAVARVSRMPAVARRGVVAVCALWAGAHFTMGFNCCYRSAPVYHFYDVARWVESNTDVNDTIGVFQSGAIGYLSNRRVVNLDGKVNGAALAALKSGELESYIREAGIDVVMDHKRVLSLFLGPTSGEDRAGIASHRVFTGGKNSVPGWIGYRLSDGPNHTAGAAGVGGGGGSDSSPTP